MMINLQPSDDDTKVRLQPSDDDTKVREVLKRAVINSTTLKNMLDDLGSDAEIVTIPLQNVRSNILDKIIEYWNYHLENDNVEDIAQWDAKFCEVEQSFLFELILAANYLDIKPLLETTCKTVANMIKGCSAEQIRKIFNIKNDFTPEEEEKVIKENDWYEK